MQFTEIDYNNNYSYLLKIIESWSYIIKQIDDSKLP